MGVVIVEGERAVLGLNLGRPIVTNGDFATRILFWIFPNLDGQRNPKWPAKPRHPNDSYLRAFMRTVRVVGKKGGSWF